MFCIAIEFSIAELWLLQGVIRHELAAQGTWKFPPASIELNDQVAAAILRCYDHDVPTAFLELTRGDTLAIDFLVPNTAKDQSGVMIGKAVLLKSFKARADLAEWFAATAEEPEVAFMDKLAEWEQTDQKVHSKYRNRRRKE